MYIICIIYIFVIHYTHMLLNERYNNSQITATSNTYDEEVDNKGIINTSELNIS